MSKDKLEGLEEFLTNIMTESSQRSNNVNDFDEVAKNGESKRPDGHDSRCGQAIERY